MIPAYNIISVDECVARTKMDLRLADSTEHDAYIEILIREGLGSLNCLNQLQKKQCQIETDGCNVKLPSDLVTFIALGVSWQTTDITNGTKQNRCGRLLYADLDFLNQCGCSTNNFADYRQSIQINKGYIHFNSDITLTDGQIVYMGMWLDENGKPAIFERFERALTAYACWKFSRTWSEKSNQYNIESFRIEWGFQREKLKGMAVADDFNLNKREIGSLMSALLISPAVNF